MERGIVAFIGPGGGPRRGNPSVLIRIWVIVFQSTHGLVMALDQHPPVKKRKVLRRFRVVAELLGEQIDLIAPLLGYLRVKAL
jgi:hypothetical protein